MLIIGALGGGAFVVTALVLGVRLVVLHRSTRQLPELLIGIGFLAMGGVSWPFVIVARLVTDLPDSIRAVLVAIFIAGMIGGVGALGAFNYLVFRRGDPTGRGILAAISGGHVCFAIVQAIHPGLLAFANGQGGIWNFSDVFLASVLGWACFESSRYYLKLKKRLAFGLADPVVADRIKMWALGTVFAFATAVTVLGMTNAGPDPRSAPAALGIVGLMGLFSSSAMWLAFLPPVAYQKWRAKRNVRPYVANG